MTSRNPRLAFVSTVFLQPEDAGGKIRTSNVLRGLKGGAFETTLISPGTPEQVAQWATELARLADHFVPWTPAGHRPRWMRAHNLLGSVPVNVSDGVTPEARGTVQRVLAEGGFDVVVFDFVHATELMPAGLKTPSVCFTHNVEAEIFERHSQNTRGTAMGLVWASQAGKMRRYEREALHRYTRVIGVSDRDARQFSKDFDLPDVAVIPTAVDLDFFSWTEPPASPPTQRPTVAFTGSMDWMANVDGVEFFLAEVWPLVLAKVPQARFVVVGRNPPAALVRQASASQGVEFTGFVDDVRPHVRQAQAFIIPLRVGGGTRIKAFEAMAMGCPVVSTAIGIEGLDVEPDRHFLLRDSPQELAQGVIDLLSDATLRVSLSTSARDVVERRFGHMAAAQVFERICLDAMDEPANAPRQTLPTTPSPTGEARRPVRMLLFSTLFPSSARPVHGIFVETRLRELLRTGDAEVKVVAPVPWFWSTDARHGERAKMARTPPYESRNGIEVHHPRYALIPKFGMTLAPILLALGALPTVRRLQREGFEFDLIDAHYYYPDGVAAAMIARWLDKPLVITARGTDLNLIPQYALPRRMIRWAARRADASIGVCAALVDVLREMQIDPARLHVMRNGVDLQRFKPLPMAESRSQLAISGQPVLLSVGHLIERKGHHLAIDAMQLVLRSYPDARLVIVGEGEERGNLEERSRRLGMESRVSFAGAVANESMKTWYSAADVLILASSREGWANVLLEAMACGCPVAATRIWGTPEVVADDSVGLLFEQRDGAALAGTLLSLLGAPRDRSVVRKYAENFGWEHTTNAQLALFRRLVASINGRAHLT